MEKTRRRRMSRAEKNLRNAFVSMALPRLVDRIMTILSGPRWPRTKWAHIKVEYHDTIVNIVYLMLLSRRTI